MARPIARDAEDFARLMLRMLEQQGEWLAGRELFERAAARHPEHPYLAHVAARPARRSALNATLEALCAAEFPHLEQRKDGARRNAATLYRDARPAAAVEPQAHVSLDLHLPYETPASHPLLDERRAAEARGEQPASSRRSAMTVSSPRSPWRRRLLPLPLPLPRRGLEQAWHSVRECWERLRAALAGFATGVGGR